MDKQENAENRGEELLTPREVGQILKVGYRRVLDMIALGDLRAYRIGHLFRISRKELQHYLESTVVESSWRD